MFKGHGYGEVLSQRVPSQVALLQKLLHVLRSGSAGPGLEQAAASQQRHYRQHLRRGAQLQYGEQVGQVISQDVSCHGDRVQAVLRSLAAAPHRMNCCWNGRCCCTVQSRLRYTHIYIHTLLPHQPTWRENGNVETARVVEKQILLHFLDEIAIVSAVVVQPEDSGHPCGSSSGHSQSNLAIITRLFF